MRRMYPNDANRPSFEYPANRLLPLRGSISDSEMRHPTSSKDQKNKPCLMVIKDGSTTGITIGRANSITSYTRHYPVPGNPLAPISASSREWAILPFDNESGAFSASGDSGAVIVDGLGRVGGLLTGGTRGVIDSLDISYATPIDFIVKSIKTKYPSAHLYSTDDWEALFEFVLFSYFSSLLRTLITNVQPAGDLMGSAGLPDVLVSCARFF